MLPEILVQSGITRPKLLTRLPKRIITQEKFKDGACGKGLNARHIRISVELNPATGYELTRPVTIGTPGTCSKPESTAQLFAAILTTGETTKSVLRSLASKPMNSIVTLPSIGSLRFAPNARVPDKLAT